MKAYFIRVRLHKFWSTGTGLWSVLIERPTDALPLTRPLTFFLNDKLWDHFAQFPKVEP